MNKRDVKKPAESRPSLRRTTRALARRATSPKNDNSQSSNDKNPSPVDKDRATRIKINEGKKNDPLVTPKSSKTLSHIRRTPTGSEDGFYSNCSQQDPNRLVVWDCSSPDAVRYIQQRRRRRHASDVADIVQNLIVPEEDGDEEAGKEFLLEKWLESKPLGPEQMKVKANKPGKRKERGRRLRKDVLIPEELMERLHQAVIGANEETDDTREQNGAQSKLDMSKDLFENSKGKDSFMVSPVFGKKTASKADTHLSDASWSEDDFFDNDSFIIKATQNPEEFFSSKKTDKSGEKDSIPCKRKTSGNSVEDQPLKKIVKYSNDPPKSTALQNHTGKPPINVNRKVQSIPNQKSKVQPKSSSPFRKFRSFEDDQTGKSSFRSDNAQKVKPIGTAKQSFSNVASQRNASTSAINTKDLTGANRNLTSSRSITPNTGNISNSSSGTAHLQNRPSIMIQKPIQNQNPKTNCVSNNNQAQPFSVGNRTGQLSFPTKACGSFYKAVNSSQVQSSHTYSQYKNASRPVPPKPATTTIVKTEPQQNNANGRVVRAKGGNTKRRSAGMFDTSLPDDLLCQLAEPDEILESQASPNSKKSEHWSKESNVHVLKKETVCANTSSSSHSSANKINTDTTKPRNTFSIKSEPCDKIVKPVEMSHLNAEQSKNSNLSGVANTKKEPVTNKKLPESQNPSNKGVDHQLPSSSKTYSFKSKSSIVSISGSHTSVVKTEKQDRACEKPVVIAANKQPKKPVSAIDDSEDLFASDEDDNLEEPEILAFLDDVEMKATQMENPDRPICSQGTDKKPGDDSHSESCDLMSEEVDHGPSNSQSSNSQSPFKCTPEDIERKRQAAISKLKKKTSGSNIHDSDDFGKSEHSSSQSSQSLSPLKCTPDEIEHKRQAALSKLHQKKSPEKCHNDDKRGLHVTTPKDRKGSSSSNSHSPFKCSPSEIEQKKNAALAKRRQKSGVLSANKSPHNNNNMGSAQKLGDVSPAKLMHDEIERKKQAALRLREERQKATRNLTSSLSMCSKPKR